jgi:hypothetical protein
MILSRMLLYTFPKNVYDGFVNYILISFLFLCCVRVIFNMTSTFFVIHFSVIAVQSKMSTIFHSSEEDPRSGYVVHREDSLCFGVIEVPPIKIILYNVREFLS